MDGPNNNGGTSSEMPLNDESPEQQQQRQHKPNLKEFWCSWRLVELLLCFVPLIIGAITEVALNPRQRPIPYQYLDTTGEYVLNQVFAEVFQGETVPTLALVLICGFLPFMLQYLLIQCCSYGITELQKWELIHKTLCVWVVGMGTTIMVTNSIKLYVGYLRPIFYDQCQPNEDFTACTAAANSSSTGERQLRLSFPSGHASMSVCGMLLFSKFLEQRFGMYKDLYRQCYGKQQNHGDADIEIGRNSNALEQSTRRSPTSARFGRIASLLCYSPMAVALFVAASRVVDNKHFPADVVGGSLLGGSIAHLVFSIWFPSWEQLWLGG